MKTINYFLPLLFALFFHNFSFAQSQSLSTQKTSARVVSSESADILEPDCPYPVCQELFEEVKAAYRPLANELCEDIFIEVTCCYDGYVTYAHVRVQPNSPKCGRSEGIDLTHF